MGNPLTDNQEHALQRALGTRGNVQIVMVAPGSHYARITGSPALVLDRAHSLPGGRNIRFTRLGSTIYAADITA